MNKENIFCIQNEFGKNMRNVSYLENEWSSVMEFLHPEKEFISEFNNENGQIVFKEAIPDLYSEKTQQCYFFNGCKIHQHLDNSCPFNNNANENTIGIFGQSFKETNDLFYNKMERLLTNNVEKIQDATGAINKP